MSAQFGPFQLIRLLGRGGMAEVFVAKRDNHCEPIVLKRVRPDLAHNESIHKRFTLEAQVVSRFNHRNLASFREFGKVGECHYIIMEQIRGHSLHRLLNAEFKQQKQPPLNVALHLTRGILQGLGAMHGLKDQNGCSRPMLHRDITPSNIIVNTEGDPVLIDFGITKDVHGPSLTDPGEIIGKGRYMAPEHRAGDFADVRADVFSCSIVFYELIAGQHPWPPLPGLKELLRTVFDPPKVPAQLRKAVPPSILAIVLKGLDCDPNRRWASASQMLDALNAASQFLGEDPHASVIQWVNSLGLPIDEALSSPVIDLMQPTGRRTVLIWNADGQLSSKRKKQKETTASTPDAAILSIPPLPPRRDQGIDLDDATREAIGLNSPEYLWKVVGMGIALCLATICILIFFSSFWL